MTDDVISYENSPTSIVVDLSSSQDQEKAGYGLRSFPLINEALQSDILLDWLMSPAERVALLFLLEHLRPKVSIEIGTKNGGSLQVLSKFCDRVYSIDIDPEVPKRLEGQFENVEYLIGPSDSILPSLVDRLQREQTELGFALVDGNHSAEGVRKDIDNLLRFRPAVPFYIIMHDSFNPQCRLGLRNAKWLANKYVHAVELDFVPGVVCPVPALRNQMWGGFAMGILLPHQREGYLEITARSEQTYQAALRSAPLVLKQLADQAKRTLPLHTLPLRAIRKARGMLVSR
jgi:hypothetical protein